VLTAFLSYPDLVFIGAAVPSFIVFRNLLFLVSETCERVFSETNIKISRHNQAGINIQ